LVVGGEWMTFKSAVTKLRGETWEGKRRSGCCFGGGVEEAGDSQSMGGRWRHASSGTEMVTAGLSSKVVRLVHGRSRFKQKAMIR
jgi:hypothetical protein